MGIVGSSHQEKCAKYMQTEEYRANLSKIRQLEAHMDKIEAAYDYEKLKSEYLIRRSDRWFRLSFDLPPEWKFAKCGPDLKRKYMNVLLHQTGLEVRLYNNLMEKSKRVNWKDTSKLKHIFNRVNLKPGKTGLSVENDTLILEFPFCTD